MKFLDAINEGVEVVSKAAGDQASHIKAKAFKIDGKGPFSIAQLQQSTNRVFQNAGNILAREDVRKKIAMHIDAISADDEREMDVTMTAAEEIVIKDEGGNELARVPMVNRVQQVNQAKKGQRFLSK